MLRSVASETAAGRSSAVTWLEFVPAVKAGNHDLAAAYEAGSPTPSPFVGVDLS
jgi:hypothetical protein